MTRKEILDAIKLGNEYIDWLYKEIEGGKYGVLSEYPACPISIRVKDPTTPPQDRPAGWGSDAQFGAVGRLYEAVSKIDVAEDTGEKWRGYYSFEDWNDMDYDEPLLVVWHEPFGDKMQIILQAQKYEGVFHCDVYVDDQLVLENVGADNLPVGTILTEPFKPFRSHRYTLRHGCQLGFKHYWFNSTHPDWKSRALKMVNFLDDYGFTYDIYDPLFRMSDDLDNAFFFTTQAYRDALGAFRVHPWTCGPHGLNYYPYISKIGAVGEAYISESFLDPLLHCLVAIHLMNKYNSLTDKKFFGGPRLDPQYYSALDFLRHGYYIPLTDTHVGSVESLWVEGEGIKYLNATTAIRLAVFLAAESEAGYGFGDATSKTYADKAAEILLATQWKGDGTDNTHDHGFVKRPDHRGGFMVAYEKTDTLAFRTPSWGIISEIADIVAMKPETLTMIPTNLETTLIATRALMIYEAYKYRGLTGPIPRLLILADVDFDGMVDLLDVVKVAKAYESKEGDPQYSPSVDLNGDGVVDIFDLVKAAKAYERDATPPPRKITVTVPTRQTISSGVEGFTSTLATCAIISVLTGAVKAWKR